MNEDFFSEIEEDFGIFEEDPISLEILNTFSEWIDCLDDLTFYEKTFILMNRKGWTAQDLADDAGVSKTMLSLVRKNVLTNKTIAKRLIKLCEQIGLQCEKEKKLIEMA